MLSQSFGAFDPTNERLNKTINSIGVLMSQLPISQNSSVTHPGKNRISVVHSCLKIVACVAVTLPLLLSVGCEDPGEPDLSGIRDQQDGQAAQAGGNGSSQAIPQFSPISDEDRE